MTDPLFIVPSAPQVPVAGERAGYPVRRIFCVGRNYAAHAAEMGNEVDREAPFYFTKSAQAICPSGADIAYPPGTKDCHYEMELVVALGADAFRVTEAQAMRAVLGYACGIDLTRRDLQAAAKDKRRPWDLGKDFEASAIIAEITRKEQFGDLGDQAIRLSVDGVLRQDAHLSDMIWSVPEMIADLSRYYHLAAGDLIYTGTPAGVGPVAPGNVLLGEIEGLTPLHLTVTSPE
ncbi:fumarylacetoacetate hydrolase family protein [Roseovarius sp. D22-M7]|uniref:fumarylacetoacetate hydrolase family protein n=1 Tax=Roseovarius sp. D22-M7 TaxID=3127116 RepID=UPI0030105853